MSQFRIAEIAEIAAEPDGRGRCVVDGASAARLAQGRARNRGGRPIPGRSSCNQFVGLVTGMERGEVMCRVELLCGDVTIESLISVEAADELGLEPGTLAVATAAATQVIVERV